ncbi:MAG: SpoIIIAH-like family protein [Syntrophomonadaceae bacterium]|jgi:stage III sporulation protein AH|nr:SpoIIIAH-like family protein [Thermoanaerobacterales bacterium]NLN20962.1 SpoIIIAH-like family protein [Syntrophomonadaceae bacterium]
MIYYVCEPKKIIKTGLILVLILAGCWLFLKFYLMQEQPQVNVEVDVKQSEKTHLLNDVKKQEFFVDCRLTRDRIRSQQMEVLKEIAANTASSSETRDQAQQGLMKLTERSTLEAELEKLVIALGFKDAVVMLQDTAANVIIQQNSLTDSEKDQIRDVVVRVTDLQADDVFITCKP